MKNFSIALLAGLISLTLATLSPRAAFGAEPPPQRTLLVFGDSLSAAYGIEATDGWVNLRAEKLATENPHYTVANASVSGTVASRTGGVPASDRDSRTRG